MDWQTLVALGIVAGAGFGVVKLVGGGCGCGKTSRCGDGCHECPTKGDTHPVEKPLVQLDRKISGRDS